MTHYTVLSLPTEERPRERLLKHGIEAMSSTDLLAIILGSGTRDVSILELSHAILARFETLQKIAEASVSELCQIKGLGPAKALQLKAAIGLGLRASKHSIQAKYRIDNPLHAYHLVKDELRYEKREVFMVLLLDVRGCSLGKHIISIGTISSTLVHPREVFNVAIRHQASSLILIHNHPSGDSTPSEEDFKTTKVLIEAGKIIGIPINDHLIIGDDCYVSLRQKGVNFS